jgi:hypothetical protein
MPRYIVACEWVLADDTTKKVPGPVGEPDTFTVVADDPMDAAWEVQQDLFNRYHDRTDIIPVPWTVGLADDITTVH